MGTFWLGDLGGSVPLFLMFYAVAFAGYVLAIGTAESRSLVSVLAWGCAFRVTMLLSEPSLSDDIYRYLWDGVVQLHGINPYRYAPAAPELSVVVPQSLLQNVNHPGLPTIYPPLAQLFFRLCAWIAPETWVLRLGLSLMDCVTLFFIAGLARSYDMHPSIGLVYFWNPLVLVEGAGQGHIDLMGVCLLVVALLYIRLHGYGRAAAALALGGLTKFLPILMVPTFWRWAGKTEADGRHVVIAMLTTRAVLVPVVFGVVFAAGYYPFLDVGWGVLGSLGTYAESWEFNAPIYSLLRWTGFDSSTARIILGSGLILVFGAVSVSRMPPIQGAFFILGAYLLLTPTLHPWYVVWIIPFLCFYGHRGWIALSGLIVFAYVVLIEYRESGIWEEDGWVSWLILLGAVGAWLGPRLLAYTKKEGPPQG